MRGELLGAGHWLNGLFLNRVISEAAETHHQSTLRRLSVPVAGSVALAGLKQREDASGVPPAAVRIVVQASVLTFPRDIRYTRTK